MSRLLLAAALLGGFTALAASGAKAAPSAAGVHVTSGRPLVTQADYGWNHHRWHHRRWEHRRWHYWN